MAVWAKGALTGAYDNAAQYAKQKGIDLSEALQKYGLEEPDIPQGFEFVWGWFFELAEGRSHNGFGWNAISWQEIMAWAQMAGVHMQPWLARCFRMMDQEWLKAAREQENGKRDTSGNKHSRRRR